MMPGGTWGQVVKRGGWLQVALLGYLPSRAVPFSAVTLEGSYKDQIFDQRELRFEMGEGESLDLPCGLEKALQRMEKGKRAVVYLKPR